MSYTLTALDDGHILLFEMHADFDVVNDLIAASREALEIVEHGPDRVVMITDTREMKITGVNDLLQGANAARSPEAVALSKHPKLFKSVSVIDNKMVTLAAKGLNSATFGYIDTTIFEDREKALAYARAVLV